MRITGRHALIGWYLLAALSTLCALAGENRTPMNTEKAMFAGGCFWCIEAAFEKTYGVLSAVSGYTGGTVADPTYQQVASGTTGHREAVEVTFDPTRIRYPQLLDIFWRHIDPTDASGQFADKGSPYQTAIYYYNDTQKKIAEESKKTLSLSGKFTSPIATRILPAGPFYRAEEYHQDYARKNAQKYQAYHSGSGRAAFLKKTWADTPASCPLPVPHDAAIKSSLSPLQYRVTKENATEQPFVNEYWNNHREGIYVDIISGDVVFLSKHKFDSGTGWPSFTQPASPNAVYEKQDTSQSMKRIEVRGTKADSHLGHVFNDGPNNTRRFCINSAALRFIPRERMEQEGYGEYVQKL